MSRIYYFATRLTCCLTILLPYTASSQSQDTLYRHMFRVYEDNDIIKLFGDVSDKGYTNGTRLDYYYIKNHKSTFFVDNWMPKAGSQSVNAFGVGLTQTIYTPEDLTLEEPDVADWPYTGALFLSHTLNSSNPSKTYSLNTEIIVGVMGKASMAEQMQKTIHKIIGSDQPMGWDKQYPTDILLNLNFSLEKQLWHYGRILEVIGGGEGMVGTMINGASLYGFIRIGKMQPYFNGFIQQYARPFRQKNKLQVYAIIKPSLDWVGYNAVLEGGVFSGRSDYYDNVERVHVNNSISRRLDLELVAGYGCVSLSFTQRIMPRLVDGFSHQRLGNISLHVAF
jgi:lipid A 3-O-deacylase